jgi:hypothetical protein
VFFEDFINDVFENGQPLSTSPLAEWAEPVASAATSGGLRASVGVSETAHLGDFLPQAKSNFDSGKAYIQSSASKGDPSPEFTLANYKVVLLNTDAQVFPLPDGSTNGLTDPVTILGGSFTFRDFIIPVGVRVVVVGSNPLRITATGNIEIHGVLDLDGTNGFSDDTFDSGFLAVPGGDGGPGGGRGGDGHPTRFDPQGTAAIDQYVTPETGEQGFGPVLTSSGAIIFKSIGGRGGLCALGYNPSGTGVPKVDAANNREEHRSPGGGGGSFYSLGDQAHEGSGTYIVQSESSWFPFSKCPTDDKVHDALYGNGEKICAGVPNSFPLQCVYMLGTPEDPVRKLPGGLPGDPVFTDGDPSNDFIGPGGELAVVIGGQGGGGGGSRVDSMRHKFWSINNKGACDPAGPPYYPKLQFGISLPPTLYDAKGGAGGGGGGSALIQSYGDIVLSKFGHITARGGHGGGGEVVRNANFGAGGGGGSGGAVILQAAGDILLQADQTHRRAGYTDQSGDNGASIAVSGGFGRDARSDPNNQINFIAMTFDHTRSDGGQGGMGLIQLQAGGSAGVPQIEEGAYAFAKRRTILKQGKWTGDLSDQQPHPTWNNQTPVGMPDELRYIEMLHHRYFEALPGVRDVYFVLNGSHPPIIASTTGQNGNDELHEYPTGSGQLWHDTQMMASDLSGGKLVVRETQPEKVMKSYLGYNANFIEPFWQSGAPPGELYDAADLIPMSVNLNEPDGTPILAEPGVGVAFEPSNLIYRLPVIHPSLTPAPFGTVSRGTSQWLDYSGATLRTRSVVSGRSPPTFLGMNGTNNAGSGEAYTAEAEGRIRLGAVVPPGNIPARMVVDAGFADPGLFPGPVGLGTPPNPPFNDVAVHAPDAGVSLTNVVTDNANVTVFFQGAYSLRAGSHVPDSDTQTAWLADITELSGYPLIRFQVVFDLGASPVVYPFNELSMRPLVDYLRIRADL